MNKNKIIYIAGLGHSGTTILDMILGVHKKIIGLGEIMPFIRRKNHLADYKSTCSCGKKGDKCEFWSKAEDVIKNSKNEDSAYFKLTDFFFKKYGKNTILVDSSKNSYNYLEKIKDKYDLKVIFLTRDFRSWAFSRFSSKKFLPIFWGIRWLAEIMKLENRFKKMNISLFRVGYEELALYPDFVIPKICDFIEVDYQKQMLNPSKTKSHIINGNLVRADLQKSKKITYDARWMTSSRISLMNFWLFFLNKFNKSRVYSNILDKNMSSDELYLFSKKRTKELDKKHN